MILKVGILGNGNAAAKHRAAYAELPELFSVVEPTNADVIDICTPPHMHFPQANEWVWAKRHVIVEKPICGSLYEATELMVSERESGNRICPIFQYRFATNLPPPSILHFSRSESYYAGWRGEWDTAIGGCLTSHGIHAIDALLHMYGPVDVVRCDFRMGAQVEDCASLALRLVNPVAGTSVFPLMVLIDKQGGNTDLGDSHTGYVNQFRLIHEALTTGGPLPVTLAEARASLEVLTAAYYSAYTGEPVTLPILPDHPFYQGWSQHFALRSQQSAASRKTPGSPDRPIPAPA